LSAPSGKHGRIVYLRESASLNQ